MREQPRKKMYMPKKQYNMSRVRRGIQSCSILLLSMDERRKIMDGRKVLQWFFVTVLIGLLTGCSSEPDYAAESQPDKHEMQPEEQVSLAFFYSSADVNWMSTIEELAQNFMLENPHIVLEMQPAEKGTYNESLKIKAALGEFPDIFEIQNPYLFEEAEMLGVIPESVRDLVQNPVIIKEQCYAVPLYSTTYGMVYNRLLFKQYGIAEPQTYAEFQEVCAVLEGAGVTPIAVGGSKQDYMTYWLNYFFQTEVLAVNANWISDRWNGRAAAGDQEIKQMLEQYRALFQSGHVYENFSNMNDSGVISKLIEGEVAMVYTGPWLFSQIAEAYPDALISDKDNLGKAVAIDENVTFQLGWFFMPDQNGDAVVINVPESNWAISAACAEDPEKAEAVRAFLEYFYGVENYRKVLQSMNALPTTKAAVLYPSDSVQRELLNKYSYANVIGSYLGDYQTPEAVKVYLYRTLPLLAADKQVSIDDILEQLDAIWDDSIAVGEGADEKQ